MASNYKKKQKRHLIAAIICCVLVAAIIATTVIVCLVHKKSICNDFADKDFAAAIAESMGLKSRYDLDQEDLDKYEGLVYFCSVGNDTANNYATYAYPVVMLCDKTYTDFLIRQSQPGYEATEEEKNADYSKNYVAVPYLISDPSDINLFGNLRVLRAFDTAELSEISNNCYYTQLYATYGMGTAVSFDSVIGSCALNKLTSLEQIKSLDKLEQLSLCYTGITDLKGIENFPKLTKLDASYTQLKSVEGLSAATELSILSLNSVNTSEDVKKEEPEESAEEPEESTEEPEESVEETSEEPAEESSEEPEESKDPHGDDDKAKEEEPDFNDGGLASDDLAEIAKLPKLIYLDLTNNNLSDLSALSALSGLEYISVSYNPIADLKGLENAKGLKSLYATNCVLTDGSALNGIKTLESVNVSENKLVNLDFLSASTGMTSLTANCNLLANADAVSGMTKLETLVLTDNKIIKAPDLSGMTVLTAVELSENYLTDASGLENFNPNGFEDEDKENPTTVSINLKSNNLRTLKLTSTRAANIDVSDNLLVDLDLTACTAVTSLTVSENPNLKNVTGLGKLAKLTTLTAEKCNLSELESVGALENLTTLTLSNSKLTSFEFLKDSKSVTTVTAADCSALTDLSALHTVEKLATLDLSKCTGLNDDSIAKGFGTVTTDADGKKTASLLFDATSKLSVTLTGCSGITDYAVFDEYGNMTVKSDNTATK